MALRSTPVDPRPMLPLTWTSAPLCRRLPLMRTSTWSGPSPRSVAGRTESVPSVMVGRGKLKEGASAWMIWFVSLAPAVVICWAVSVSTGTAFSAAAPARREPTVISSWKPNASAKSLPTWPDDRLMFADCGWSPGKVTRISTLCPLACAAGMTSE